MAHVPKSICTARMSHPGFRQVAAKRCSSVPRRSFSLAAPSAAVCRSSFRNLADWDRFPRMVFARTLTWELAEAAPDHAILNLRQSGDSLSIWPHKFELEYTVRIGGNRLELSFKATNTDSMSFEFTSALHTYLRVHDLQHAAVGGLKGLWFVDRTNPSVGIVRQTTQQDEQLDFLGEVDRLYFDVTHPLQLIQNNQRLSIEKSGFADVVIWNPGREKCAASKDMRPNSYLEFVCVEAAAVEKPIRLGQGESWVGIQRLIA